MVLERLRGRDCPGPWWLIPRCDLIDETALLECFGCNGPGRVPRGERGKDMFPDLKEAAQVRISKQGGWSGNQSAQRLVEPLRQETIKWQDELPVRALWTSYETMVRKKQKSSVLRSGAGVQGRKTIRAASVEVGSSVGAGVGRSGGCDRVWSLGTYKKRPEGREFWQKWSLMAGQLPPPEQKYAPPVALPWSWDWGPQLANDLCCQDKLRA